MSGVHFVFYSHAHLQKMSPRIRIVAPSSGILKMETSEKKWVSVNGTSKTPNITYNLTFVTASR